MYKKDLILNMIMLSLLRQPPEKCLKNILVNIQEKKIKMRIFIEMIKGM